MSGQSSSPVFLFDNDDPEMQKAYDQARASFRYFWRECAWEQRRIVPGLDLACVKAPFADPGATDSSQVEQMWVDDVDYDGTRVEGTLLNAPNWLTSVSQGDRLQLPCITDWMYAIHGRVYGAFTVNLIRSRMSPDECAQHDEAWGLDFGDPRVIEVIPPPADGAPVDLNADHPMSINMGESLQQHLAANPHEVQQADDRGWTMLHQLALAGSTTGVTVLLAHGADPNAVTGHGLRPLHLANVLGWTQVAQILTAHGAQ